MRALPLLALLLTLPAAQATPSTEPYSWSASFDEPPEVGRTVTLTVALSPRGPIDAVLALDVPPWIEVEEPREWRAQAREGERVERAWRLRATQAGFWRVALAVDPARASVYGDPVDPAAGWEAVQGCCLLAWSSDGRALAGTRPEEAVPGESTVGYHPGFRAVDGARAEMTLRISPQDKRYAGETLVVEIPPGSEARTAPADAWHDFAHVFDLAPGASATLAAGAWVGIGFEAGPLASEEVTYRQRIACATFHLVREGDVVRETARSGCEPAPAPRRGVLAPPVGLALAATLAGALVLRGRARAR